MIKIDDKELNELFIELKHNNKIAFEKLYTKYNKLVYGIAFSILKNKEDSEDVVQIVFSKLYKIDKNKLPSNKEASWLYTLTKNETISFLRKKNNDINLESIYEIEDKDNEINNIIDQVEFNRLISGLNDKEKQIISLKILANLSFDEIGKLLNEPTGTIKWRYYKSIHTLKILLSNLGMFIVTFVIGIKTLFNKKISNKIEQEEIIEDSQIEQNQENLEDEATKSEIQESLKDETNNDINESQNEGIKEEIGIPEQPNTEQINYYGVGILSISSIFLIITITFTIIFVKYQLKRNKKTSK
jgi:RNA polymerase sigma-70 factor (ECF subfamily)